MPVVQQPSFFVRPFTRNNAEPDRERRMATLLGLSAKPALEEIILLLPHRHRVQAWPVTREALRTLYHSCFQRPQDYELYVRSQGAVSAHRLSEDALRRMFGGRAPETKRTPSGYDFFICPLGGTNFVTVRMLLAELGIPHDDEDLVWLDRQKNRRGWPVAFAVVNLLFRDQRIENWRDTLFYRRNRMSQIVSLVPQSTFRRSAKAANREVRRALVARGG
jgi:hypothetical protein